MASGILCVNKPAGMTSHDVVSRAKRCFACKVGHTGTLDPQARGVLVLLVDKATKALPFLDISGKVYQAQCKLGVQYSTGDIWGEVIGEQAVPQLDRIHVEAVLSSFLGIYMQTPPMVSAKKIKGRKLYEYARQGVTIEREPTRQEIYSIELLAIHPDEFSFRVAVSSGTYVRSLCEDIAAALGTVGAMSALNREQVGQFTLADCCEIEALEPTLALHPVLDFIRLPQVDCTDFLERVQFGQRLELACDASQVLLVHQNQALAVYALEHDHVYKNVRGLW